ncbi:hypothetical protein CYJ96_11935 [Moraxella osloensis]|uniref:Filamentous haemagglutinin FhaB/tRNA nuclease CdiA-like TPS domain-containing protein n=1 Tax=Faucicola osloensis TaxID=34062 RepID=A0A2I1RF82_FAUOS|nr:hemagglutinin repeat-containing protein [Moraxella osloensis]PKZ67780.1 hypothetical protein CYJ96_11935 [Moraxella osloensis]
MNSRLYRVIFNKNLGRLIVVSEKTVAQGKAGSQGGHDNSHSTADSQAWGMVGYCYGKWLTLTAAVLVSLGAAQWAHADVQTQVIADSSAAKNEQATILTTTSGMTQVNIQTPSAAGVSKNSFSQFDVGSDGVILNNSRKNTQTQTAGWVEGNPWLGKGEAKVILGQVNSTSPSQLAGYTEIAGGKAELVIANPAGITCSGCGFINAYRTTLTTGQAQMADGRLTGFDVGGGKIRIDGKGLDTSTSDYTQLIAQTNEINAKVYAKNLDVISGSNQVSYDSDASNTQITHKDPAATNQATGVALDVSSLGGMYAGKIRLIGTDKGLGVTNAGDISASNSLSLDAQGNLTNTGFMGAKDGATVNVNGNAITNSGTIASSQQGVQLTSSSLTNSGLISARSQGSISNTTTNNTGTLSAGQVNLTTDSLSNQGRIEQTGSGNLAVTTNSLTNQHQAIIGQALYADQPAAANPSLANAPSTAATGSQQVANNTSNSTNPTPDTSVPVLEPVTANGQISAKQIDNQGSNAIITANGGINVTTQILTNTDKSSIAVNGLQAANRVNNQNSRIQLDTLNWQLSQFNNAQGQIVSKQGINLTSQSPINNAQGVLATLGDARIDSAGAINNSDGVIQGKVTDIRAASLDNSRGTIDAKGNLTLTSQGDLINTQGNISAQGDANITAAGLNNDRGAITATGGLTTQSQNLINSGQLYGGTGNRLTSGAIDNSGIIGSGGATTITASSLNNTSTGVLAAGLNADGTLSTHKADLIVNTTGALTSRGTHLATGKFSLTGNPTDLAGSTTQAGEISLSSDGDLSTQGAKLTATETMTLNAKGTLNNQKGELAATTLNLTANALDNRHGNITQAGTSDLSLNLPGGLNNQDGVIATNSQNLTINTADLNNQTGNIQHAGSGSLLLTASRVNNSQQGSVLSLGEQTWQIAADINNSDNQQRGGIQGKRFDITANNLNNDNGVVAALSAASTADSRLDLTGTLANTNKAAVYASNGSLAITASDINNAGQISSRDQLTTTSQRFSNTGSVYAGGNAAITNQGNLTNTAMMAAGNQLTLDTGSLTQTATGQLVAGLTPDGKLSTLPAHLTITSRDAQSNAGLNLATGDLTVSGAALNYTGSQNQAQTIALTAKTGDITLSGAQTQAAGQIALTTPASLIHDSLDATHKPVMQADRFAMNAGNLSNQGGTINQTGSADFTIHTGNFNNQGGQLGGNASNLNVTATGIVNNQDGALIHTGSGDMRISGASVNNTRGQLITNRGLTLTSAGTVTNDAGVIQAAQATITAGQLTNQAINNQGGKILTSQGDLTVTGSVNSQGSDSVIQSANDLTVNGGTITNSNGAMLSAAKALTVNADALNNDKALIVANQAMAINAGSTTNSGSIGSVNDAVTIAGGSLTNTASGSIQAAKAITIAQGNVANQGQIASNDALNVTGSGAIDNHSGTLAGSNVALTAQTLNNNAGFISQSAADGSLTITTQGLLDNQYTKSSDATKPLGMLANGTAVIHAGDVNNDSGRINADTLNLTSTGSSINNKAGEIAAKQALTINAGNANLTNQTGQLMGHTTRVTAAVVDNSNHGLVLANQDLTVNAGTISNSDTKQAPDAILSQGLVAGGDATLTAAVIDNSNGQVVAGNAATLNVSQTLNNANGRIESNRVQVNGSANVDNSTGLIKGYEQVDLTGKSLTNTGGQLRAPTLNVALTDSFTHGTTDKLEADNLSLTTQGAFINQGKLAAAKRLAVTAQNIDNQKDASLISAGTDPESGNLIITATNDLKNRGLINGINTYLTAGNTLNNLSYGRIYGDHIAIKANTLNNTPEGYGTPAPVIAARQQLDIGVKQLNNNPNPDRAGKFNSDFNGQAQLLSNGDLNIGGDLDTNHMATGKADSVINRGATIESLGDMHIGATSLKNLNADYEKMSVIDSSKQVTEYYPNNKKGYQPIAYSMDSTEEHYDSSEAKIVENGWNGNWRKTLVTPNGRYLKYDKFVYDAKVYKDKTVSSDPALIRTGGNLSIEAQTALNDKSMVIDGQTLVLKEDPANPTRFGLTNIGATGTSKLEHSNIKHTFYETHMRKRNIGGSSRSYTEPHKQPDVPTVEKQLDSYQLPVLNADINSTFTTLPDDKQPIVDSLNKAVTALNTLKQSTQSASNQTGSADNNAAAKQDALKLLADFAKANPDNLTPDQQKQLSDILAAQKDGKGVSQAQLNGLIDSLNGSIKSQYTEEVRATGNGPTLPNSSLYNIDPNNPNGYLVETDPAFANYKKWLSSDYMMQRLGLDPSNMHKRLGDGYYEQGLIRDQVMTLTGRRFLGDYTTDDAMYQALMDNGVATAKALNLRPGIALTAEQMAQLTTDIVWLVEQTITLKDGTKQNVLVPKVYVRSKVGDLKGDSSLIAARNMDMQLTGDLTNQGNIVAHNGLRIQANNLNNQNGGVIQGNFVQVNTKNDLNNLGATLKANNAMALDVGGKLNNSSTTYHTESKLGQSNAWRTGIDQIGQIYVDDGLKGKTDDNGRPLTTLSIDVGGNATFNAGQLINQGGTTRLIAQGDVALNAVNTGFQTNAIGDSNNYYKVGQTQDIGSVVASQGSTYIQSKGGSITGTAVTIHSEDGSSYLDANKDITLKEGRATSNLETAIKTTEKSLLSRKTTQDRYSRTSDEAISGNVTGDRVVMQAGNDIQLTATNAISQSGTTLKAGNNLTLDTAENRYSQSSSHNEKKSGLFGNGGASFTLGTQKTANDNRTDSTTHTGSVVGTYNGNTVLTAGDHYQQTGSKVFAQNQTTDNPKDLNYGTTVINAKSANVTNTTATTESHNSQSQKTTGLTVSVSNSLVDQAQGINSLAKAGETTNSDQMKVMAGVAGFNKLRTLKNGIEDAMNPMTVDKAGHSIKKDTEQTLKGIGNTRIQATIGSQSSKSNQDSLSGNNEASSIDTNNLVLNIQGKGKDSDFVATGSDLNVKGDLYNNVEGDVVYQAATGKGYERSSNKSSGYGVGVYADSKNSGFTVNANTAKGYGNGETTTNANSHVTVGGTTYQNISGDLVLDGAVVKGDHMSGHIDGAILAKSRPDTATYTGKQTNAGVSADIGFDGVPQSVSVNAGRSKVNADYAAVKEQTGIAMNSSDVVVAKASRFDGAYFTTATPEDNKTVFKEGVTVTNIENHMNYKGDSINVGLGSGLNPETQKISPPGISGIGYGRDGDSQTSTTYGAVTGMAGKSDVTTANVSSLNKPLENSFDKTAVEAQLGAQVQVSQAFDTERRSYRLEMAKDEEKLRKEAKEAIEKGDEVTWRAKSEQADKQQEKMVLFDSITGAIYGPNTNDVTGYVARAVAPQVSYQIGQYFKGTNGEGTAPHILAHGILAAAVSSATGNDPTTGALSAMGAEAAAPMVAKFLFGDKPISELTADEKATVSSITSLAGLGMGATTGDVSSAVSAGETAKTAVEDNYLTKISLEKVRKHQLSIQEAEKLSQFLDSEVKKLCSKNPTNDACRTAISSQIQYIAMQEAWETMRNDVSRTSKQTFDYLYNTPNANNRFVLYFNTIDARANFFKASNQYEKNLGVGAKWFGGADYVSRTPFTGLGADGNGSYLTFGASKILGNPDIYSWRSEAGNALITQGFGNFKNLYNSRPHATQWDIKQLRDEQTLLQPIHEKYLGNQPLFNWVSNILTDTNYGGKILSDKQVQDGGINILDKSSRIKYGCKLLGYTEQQGCKP